MCVEVVINIGGVAGRNTYITLDVQCNLSSTGGAVGDSIVAACSALCSVTVEQYIHVDHICSIHPTFLRTYNYASTQSGLTTVHTLSIR